MEPQTRQAQHAADTRRALVDAARKLFSRQGYSATSLDELCERARVTKGALYHHFRNKEDLFVAVLEQVEGEFIEAGSTEADSGADVWENLRAAGRAFLDACTRPSARRIVLEAPAVLGRKRCREIEGQHVLRRMHGALERAVREGTLRSDHPEVLAQLLVALFNEASMIVAGASDPKAARRKASQELDAIIAGLRSAPKIVRR
jgi:AcrR family transcriptional regulator